MPAKIYNQSLHTKSFRLEDVFVGIIAGKLNASFRDLAKKYQIYKQRFRIEDLNPKSKDKHFFYYTANANYFISLWSYLFDTQTENKPSFYFNRYKDIILHN